MVKTVNDMPIKWCSIPLTEVINRGNRLEASVYDVEAKQSWDKIRNNKYSTRPICGKGGLGDAYVCGRFKRIWLEESALPIYQPSTIRDVYPKPDGYLSSKTKTDIEALRVHRGQVLLTCSGTIGKTAYVGSTLDNAIFSHDLIRISFKDPVDAGYVYTYLETKIGNKILLTNSYGAVITHIEPEHLESVPIPDAPFSIKKRINDLINESYELREESNQLIDKATKLLVQELHLPDLKDIDVDLYEKSANVDSFSVSLSMINGRIDASYHVPIVDSIVGHMNTYAAEVTTVGDERISKKVVLAGIFKRTYVEEEYGYPFLGGKEITQLSPKTEKFLARAVHKARYEKELKVETNMILVADRGTIGTTAFVPKHWDGWAVSQNVLKIVPANNEIAGYVYIYLNSDYGQLLIRRQTYGSVVDMIDNHNLESVEIPLLKNESVQKQINDLALNANEKRYEAYKLEQEAIQIMNSEVILD